MQRIAKRLIAAMIVATLLMGCPVFWEPSSASVASRHLPVLSLSPLAFPTSLSTRVSSTQPLMGLDPAILAALIGFAGVIVGAMIAGAFAVYQVRRTIQSEQKRQEEQFQHEQEMARLQKEHEQEMARLQKELEVQYKAKEQEEQNEATKAEVLRAKMLLSQTNMERANAYRQALHADPRISRLQILDMSRPLEVTDVYVRLRVHEDVKLPYDVDPYLGAAELQRDPNALLYAGSMYRQKRGGAAIDPDEAIRKYHCCVIVGDPGAGKTTLLKFLTLSAADGKLKGLPDLPIYIELNAFAAHSEHYDLLDFAAQEWDERYAFFRGDARSYMDEMLKEGKAVFLLDALDETIIGEGLEEAEASYQRVSNAIIRAKTRYPLSPIVVTVRKAGYQQHMPLPGFTELEVVEFRLEDIEQFVTKWFAYYHIPQQQATAIDLNIRLRRNPRIQALASNPLLLALIVLVYESQLDLPDRRADLYKRCVEVLLAEWDAKRYIRRRREFKPEHKRQLLLEIAWYFHQQGRRYFPERELLSEIARFLPVLGLPAEQHERVLREISNENGLLKEQARGWYGFLHLTLQEYFVAQYVVEQDELKTLLNHLGDPWWEEVLLLYAGQTSDASPLLQQLLGLADGETLCDDLFHTNLLLAGRCLAAFPTIRQVSLREEVIRRLFGLLTTTPHSLTRKQVAEVLAEVAGPTVNSRLLSLLADEKVYSEVRQSIAVALSNRGDNAIIPDLLGLLADEKVYSEVRQSIAVALGSLGDSSVVPDLLHLLTDRKVPSEVRQSAALALGKLGDRSAIPNLLHLLTDEKEQWSRVPLSVAAALGSLGDRSVVPDLLRLFKNVDLYSELRSSLAAALGSLGDSSVVPDLLGLLTDYTVGPAVALALGKLGDRSMVPELMHLLTNWKDTIEWELPYCIAEALGNLRDSSVVPDLQRLLTNPNINWNVRRSITVTLGNLGDHSVVPELVLLLTDANIDWNMRWSIITALGKLGDHSVVPELVLLLTNEHMMSDVRLGVAEALKSLANDEDTVRTLVAHLSASNIADSIYEALWVLSRRAGVRIFITDGAEGKQLEMIKW